MVCIKLMQCFFSEFFNNAKRRSIEIWASVTSVPTDKFGYIVTDYRMMMRPNYIAKLQVKGDHEQKPGSDPTLEVKYKRWNISDFEDIFVNDPNNRDNVRVVFIKGNSGVGKSTIIQKYVCKWAMAKQTADLVAANITADGQTGEAKTDAAICSFKLVFYLPLKFVNRHMSIMDMMLDPIVGYFKPADRYLLEKYFGEQENEARTLFILDGLEDAIISSKSEIPQLIQGEIYPRAKVVVAGRPYKYAISQIKYDPDAVVHVHGVMKASAERFIKNCLNDMSGQNIQHFLQLYQNSTLDANLLQTPLHLLMTCFLYYHHKQEGLTMDDFHIPVNMTAIFNAYLLRLLKLYLKKCGRDENCFFIRNVLSQDADIPADLKHLVYVMGRWGFLSIVNEQFVYTEDDMQANMLGHALTEKLGLVSAILPAQSNAFFFRHKLFAEYLAGIYLSMEGFRVPEFSKVFDIVEKKTLQEVFGRLQNTVRFACGVSTNFFREILKIATRKCILHGNPAKDCYLSPFDATLYFETQDVKTAFSFAWYLENTELRSKFDKTDNEPSTYEWTAALFLIDNLEFGTICKLIGRFYDMHLSPRQISDVGESIDPTENFLRIQTKYEIEQIQKTRKGQLKPSHNFHLHQTGLFLAAATGVLIFHNMHKLTIRDDDMGHMSAFLTLEELLDAFPNVLRIDMKNTALNSVTHRIMPDKKYAALHAKASYQQTDDLSPHFVSVLELDNVNPPDTVIRDLQKLQHIETIQFDDCKISEAEFESLSLSLRSSSDLRTLTINDNPLASKAINLFSILTTKPAFEELSMARCSLNEGAEILQEAMKDPDLPSLQSLQKLDVSYNNLNHRTYSVLKFFTTSNLKVLKLEGNPLGETAVVLFHQLAKKDTITELYMNNCALDGAVEPLRVKVNEESIYKMHHMDVLHICSNWLRFGSDVILRYFSSSQLTVLHLSDNPLGQAAVSMFTVLSSTDSLEELHLDNCDLDESVEAMEAAIHPDPEGNDSPIRQLHNLRELSLRNNGLNEGSLPLILYLTNSNKLKVFNLSKNPIGAALVQILDSLATNNTLRELHLEHCNLQAALHPLNEALENETVGKLRRLRLIDVSSNFLEYITKDTPQRTLETYFSSSKNLQYICK